MAGQHPTGPMADPRRSGSINGIPLTAKPLRNLAPPRFGSLAEERLHRQQRLAGALRIFGRLGFGEGVAEIGRAHV